MIRDENAGIGYEKVFFSQSKVRRVMNVLAIHGIQSSYHLVESWARIAVERRGCYQ